MNPTTYTSAKIIGRTAVEDADGTLSVFQGLEIIATHNVAGMDDGDIWDLIHAAAVAQVKEAPQAPASISPRYNKERYSMRGTAGRVGDKVERHTRRIYGKAFDFNRVRWADGTVSVRVFKGGTTKLLHEWA